LIELGSVFGDGLQRPFVEVTIANAMVSWLDGYSPDQDAMYQKIMIERHGLLNTIKTEARLGTGRKS